MPFESNAFVREFVVLNRPNTHFSRLDLQKQSLMSLHTSDDETPAG
jgi:hypothetical protein